MQSENFYDARSAERDLGVTEAHLEQFSKEGARWFLGGGGGKTQKNVI